MKKIVYFVLMIIVAVTFVACDDSIKPEGLYTTYEQLVIKLNSEIETYMVFDLEKGYAIKSCKSYMFFDWTWSLSNITKYCEETRSFPYVKSCSRSWRNVSIEYDETFYNGLTTKEIISTFAGQENGSVVYDRSWIR